MPQPFDEIRTQNTIVYCRHWSRTQTFYRSALGFPVVYENEWFTESQVAPGAFLSLADASRCTIEPACGRGLTITFRVDDADAAHARLAKRAVETGRVKQHDWGARVFYLRDPEGNRLEVWSRVER